MTTLDCGVANAVLNGFSCKAGDVDTGSDSESMVESDPVELLFVMHCIGLPKTFCAFWTVKVR